MCGIDRGEVAPLADHAFGIGGDDLRARRPFDDLADPLQDLAIVAALLREQRRVGRDAVDDAERHQRFDFLQVARIDEESSWMVLSHCSVLRRARVPAPASSRCPPTPRSSRSLFLFFLSLLLLFCQSSIHRVRQLADALDLDRDLIARLKGTDAGRGAGRDDVAGQQRHDRRNERDERGHREDELARRRRLPPLAVDPTFDGEPGRRVVIEPGAMHGPIGANVSKPLARVYWTSFSCSSRAVTSLTHVMPNTYRRVLFTHARRARADDDPHLGLVVDPPDAVGKDDRLAGPDDGGRRLEEDQRLGRQRLVLLRPRGPCSSVRLRRSSTARPAPAAGAVPDAISAPGVARAEDVPLDQPPLACFFDHVTRRAVVIDSIKTSSSQRR